MAAKRQSLRYWLFGAAAACLLFAVLAAVGNLRYENSDDMLMVKPLMGFEGGTPADFTLYTNTLLAWLLHGLALLWPAVAWFSAFQMALLWVSVAVLAKCAAQLAQNRHAPWLWATAATGALLAGFAAFACCRVNYTSTAGLAGAAAVAQLITIFPTEKTQPIRLRAFVPSLLLLACAYCLRAVSVLPALAFTGLIFLWQWFKLSKAGAAAPRRAPKTLLLALALYVATFGALAGVRQAEISLRGLQPYMDWQNARIALMDYTDFQTNPAPALAAGSGLSASEMELVRQWYFMSADISTATLQKLAAAYPKAQAGSAFTRLFSFIAQNRRYTAMGLALVLLAALSLLKVRKKPLDAAAAGAALLGTLVLLLYLAYQGRLLGRGLDTVFLPCAAFLCGLALVSAPETGAGRASRHTTARVAALALVVLTLAASAVNAADTYHAVTRAQDTVSQQREAELEAYALKHPRLLVVRDTALIRDTRLFPNVSAGTPTNLTLWGDWGCRTPSWNRQLASLGFDAQAFSAEDWLSPNLVFAASKDEETASLTAYLSDALGAPVAAQAVDQAGTLRIYRFVTVP